MTEIPKSQPWIPMLDPNVLIDIWQGAGFPQVYEQSKDKNSFQDFDFHEMVQRHIVRQIFRTLFYIQRLIILYILKIIRPYQINDMLTCVKIIL